jgi:NADH dehydrogenase
MQAIDRDPRQALVEQPVVDLAQRAEIARPVRPHGRPRVVVVGAGFGGLNVAAGLARANVDVVVLDRHNYHGFWPLLYQVATAGLEPASIAYPARAILRKYPNAHFLMTEVSGVDFERKLVLSGDQALPYDYLVLAAGSANNYFGDTALAANTFGMKDLDEAEQLRNQVLRAFERAVIEPDPARRAALLTFVIVGGGPTGVELAGAFAELIRHVLRKDYPMLDISEARVLLVEAGERILISFPERLQRSARKRLENMGVEVKLRTAVAAVDGERVSFKDGTTLESSTVVWAAGVRAAELVDALGLTLGRGARVKITPELNLPERPEVFVIGDMAYLESYKGSQPYPMVAQVAMQMGKQAARNILAQIDGRPLRAFHYLDKGQMATIGRRAAVFDAFGIRMAGFFAWIGWLFIHLIYLIGFRNRLVVLTNWAYSYFTYDRAVRLISGAERE